jgi:hypothetical protein
MQPNPTQPHTQKPMVSTCSAGQPQSPARALTKEIADEQHQYRILRIKLSVKSPEIRPADGIPGSSFDQLKSSQR